MNEIYIRRANIEADVSILASIISRIKTKEYSLSETIEYIYDTTDSYVCSVRIDNGTVFIFMMINTIACRLHYGSNGVINFDTRINFMYQPRGEMSSANYVFSLFGFDGDENIMDVQHHYGAANGETNLKMLKELEDIEYYDDEPYYFEPFQEKEIYNAHLSRPSSIPVSFDWINVNTIDSILHQFNQLFECYNQMIAKFQLLNPNSNKEALPLYYEESSNNEIHDVSIDLRFVEHYDSYKISPLRYQMTYYRWFYDYINKNKEVGGVDFDQKRIWTMDECEL